MADDDVHAASSFPKALWKRAKVLYADSSVTRLWSDEDELALLWGMIDYGKDPRSDYDAFLNFVKDFIRANVSAEQLSAKIRNLKNKFLVNAEKGDDLVFLKPHAEALFQVSKKVWGGDTKEIEKAKDDDDEQSQNDVMQEEEDATAVSESDKSCSKRRASVVKRKLTVDEPKSTRKRAARVSCADSSVIRLWSRDDELALLDGLIDYGQDPHSDYKAFFEFVQDSIHANVSIRQFKEKIIKLMKNKYLVNVEKGDDLVFAKPHQEKLFELSEKVWGGENGGRKDNGKEIGKANNDVVIQDEGEDRDEGLVGEKSMKLFDLSKKVWGGESETKDKDFEKVKDDDVIRDEVEDTDKGVVGEEKNEGLGFKEMYPYLSEVWESDVDFPKPLKDRSVPKLIGCEKIKALEKECKRVFVEELQLYVEKAGFEDEAC